MSKPEVERLLGPPDDTGGTSRRHKRPSIYLYGNLEVNFGGHDRNQVSSVHVDCPWEGGSYALPRAWSIEDWDLQPGMRIEEVQRYLDSGLIPFRTAEPEPGLTARIIVDGTRIELVFDDEGGLHSIYAPLLG